MTHPPRSLEDWTTICRTHQGHQFTPANGNFLCAACARRYAAEQVAQARAEEREIWVIEEGVEGEGVYTLAICHTQADALKVKACIEQERGHPCPDLEPERYRLPDEFAAALRART